MHVCIPVFHPGIPWAMYGCVCFCGLHVEFSAYAVHVYIDMYVLSRGFARVCQPVKRWVGVRGGWFRESGGTEDVATSSGGLRRSTCMYGLSRGFVRICPPIR